MVAYVLMGLALMPVQSPPSPAQPAEVYACPAARDAIVLARTNIDVQWITNVRVVLTMPAPELIRRRLSLRNARVEQVDERGFWIGTGIDGCRLYVQPAEGPLIQVAAGQQVDLQGEFRLGDPQDAAAQTRSLPYVYAYIVREAPAEVAQDAP